MTRTPGPSCHQTAKRADAGPVSPQGIPATAKVTLPPSRHIEAAEKYTIRASLMVYAAVNGSGTAASGAERDRQRGQETLSRWAGRPFCQAAAAAVAAVFACTHLSFASSLGGTSMSLIHCRVASVKCELPTARPAMTSTLPTPTSVALVISGAAFSCGPAPAVLTTGHGTILRIAR